MEFLTQNYFNTTTMATVDSNSATVANLLKRDETFQYTSDGYTGATVTSIVIDFGGSKNVSRIAFDEMNIKSFDMFYDGVTANTFSFTTTCDTNTSQWTTNSETAMFLRANTVSCQTITLDLKGTIDAGAERAIGWMYFGDITLNLTRTPSASEYSPSIESSEKVHVMGNGTARLHYVAKYHAAKIGLHAVTPTLKNSLYSIWKTRDPFVFCAFGTSSGWDSFMFPCVWPGNFPFLKYYDNNASAGYTGVINLMETTP